MHMPGIRVGAPMPDGSHAEKTSNYQVDRFRNHLYHAGNGNDEHHNHNQSGAVGLQVGGDCDEACAGERLLLQHHLLDPSGQSLHALSDLSRCRLKTLVRETNPTVEAY